MYPFERFTEEAKGVLTLAQEEAERSRLSYIGTEHLVIGLIRQECVGGRALLSLGQSVDGLRNAIQEVLGKSETRIIQSIIPTSRVKTVIEMSFDEARRQASPHVGTEHLLLAILLEGEGLGASALTSKGVTVDKVRGELDRLHAAGISEHLVEPGIRMHRKRQHLEFADTRGRTIEIDVVFPLESSEEECQALVNRIKGVFRTD